MRVAAQALLVGAAPGVCIALLLRSAVSQGQEPLHTFAPLGVPPVGTVLVVVR